MDAAEHPKLIENGELDLVELKQMATKFAKPSLRLMTVGYFLMGVPHRTDLCNLQCR